MAVSYLLFTLLPPGACLGETFGGTETQIHGRVQAVHYPSLLDFGGIQSVKTPPFDHRVATIYSCST